MQCTIFSEVPELLGRSLFLITIILNWIFSVSCLSCYNLHCWHILPAAFVTCLCLPCMLESLEGFWSCPSNKLLKGTVTGQGPVVRRIRSPWMLEGSCCSLTGAVFRTVWEETPHCWQLCSCLGGKDGCHQNQAAGTEVCARGCTQLCWAAPRQEQPIYAGVQCTPPGGGQWHVQTGRGKLVPG